MPNLDSVPFTLFLKQGFFGRFTGTVTDDGPGGMLGTGVIVGYFSFPRIQFTKLMPVSYVVTPDGRIITFREHLIEHGFSCERDVPHSAIYYQGEFSSPHRAEGTWIIGDEPVQLPDGWAIEGVASSGGWSIESTIS